jgi:hypothetical protein
MCLLLLTCRLVHERLSTALAEAAQDALGSESLLLLISRLQVSCSFCCAAAAVVYTLQVVLGYVACGNKTGSPARSLLYAFELPCLGWSAVRHTVCGIDNVWTGDGTLCCTLLRACRRKLKQRMWQCSKSTPQQQQQQQQQQQEKMTGRRLHRWQQPPPGEYWIRQLLGVSMSC